MDPSAVNGCHQNESPTDEIITIFHNISEDWQDVSRFRGETISFFGYTVQYGCVAHCAFEYIGEFVSCSGPSMEPTITNHDVVFSERVSRHLCRLQKYQEGMCGWKAITFGIPQTPEAMAQFPMP